MNSIRHAPQIGAVSPFRSPPHAQEWISRGKVTLRAFRSEWPRWELSPDCERENGATVLHPRDRSPGPRGTWSAMVVLRRRGERRALSVRCAGFGPVGSISIASALSGSPLSRHFGGGTRAVRVVPAGRVPCSRTGQLHSGSEVRLWVHPRAVRGVPGPGGVPGVRSGR